MADELEEGAGTVGTLMNVKHVAAHTGRHGGDLRDKKLIEVDRKRLVFEVKAYMRRRNRRGNAREIYHRQ